MAEEQQRRELEQQRVEAERQQVIHAACLLLLVCVISDECRQCEDDSIQLLALATTTMASVGWS